MRHALGRGAEREVASSVLRPRCHRCGVTIESSAPKDLPPDRVALREIPPSFDDAIGGISTNLGRPVSKSCAVALHLPLRALFTRFQYLGDVKSCLIDSEAAVGAMQWSR